MYLRALSEDLLVVDRNLIFINVVRVCANPPVSTAYCVVVKRVCVDLSTRCVRQQADKSTQPVNTKCFNMLPGQPEKSLFSVVM